MFNFVTIPANEWNIHTVHCKNDVKLDLMLDLELVLDLYCSPLKNAPLRKLDFFQIKISPICWTLKKMKNIPRNLLSVNESHGINFIFVSVQELVKI